VIVAVGAVSVNAAVVVKDAEIAVMLPARGTEKASVTRPVKSIVGPVTVTPGVTVTPLMAVPKPMRLAVPTIPPTIEVKTAGVIPEEKGIIEPVLAGGIIQAAFTAMNGPSELQPLYPVLIGR
jgi:hypothetical protein